MSKWYLFKNFHYFFWDVELLWCRTLKLYFTFVFSESRETSHFTVHNFPCKFLHLLVYWNGKGKWLFYGAFCHHLPLLILLFLLSLLSLSIVTCMKECNKWLSFWISICRVKNIYKKIYKMWCVVGPFRNIVSPILISETSRDRQMFSFNIPNHYS